MSPSRPRRRWRPAITTAVSVAMLAAIAGCAARPSQHATPSPVAAGTTPTATASPWPLDTASTGPSPSPTKTSASLSSEATIHPDGVLSEVNTPGRLKVIGKNVEYTWPGIYFEGRIRGTGVGIVLNDSGADYEVQV